MQSKTHWIEQSFNVVDTSKVCSDFIFLSYNQLQFHLRDDAVVLVSVAVETLTVETS